MIKIETDKDKDNTRLEMVGDEETIRIETIMILTAVLRECEEDERNAMATVMLLSALKAAENDLGLKNEIKVDDRLREFLKGGE